MGVNDYFGTRRKNRPHATPNYGPVKPKFEAHYNRHICCYPEKVSHIRRIELMYSSQYFNYNYMEFAGYESRDKLIVASCKGCRNTNKIRKKGITKVNMNQKSPSSTLGFGCYPHKYTFDILS